MPVPDPSVTYPVQPVPARIPCARPLFCCLRVLVLSPAARRPTSSEFLKRRTFRILGLVLLVVAFTGYFAFSTFLFPPIEGRYAYDVSTLVPRDVDFFLAKANLAKDLDAFLEPRIASELAQSEVGKVFLESPEWHDLEAALDLASLRTRIRGELDKLPIRIDPLSVFGGRDLALAGNTAGSRPVDARWAVYGRVNWMAKLAFSLLDYPGLIGLEQQGFAVSGQGGRITLGSGGLREPLHLVRVRDVLVVANDERFALAAAEFKDNLGQDSLGQSARYHDEIGVRDRPDQDELEVLLRFSEVAKWLGWPTDFPKSTSLNPIEALLGRLFQFGLARELAGVARFDGGVAADLAGSLLAEDLSPLQKRFYRNQDLDTRELVDDIARWVPSDVGLFTILQMDFGDLVEVLFEALEPALVDNLRSEFLQPALGHATIGSFAAELDATFKDRVMLQVSHNRYTEIVEEIPSNGDPVPIWTIGLWIEDPERVRALIDKLTRNPGRLGLRGLPKGNGAYDPGIYQNEIAGGLRVYEFWSVAVPGTGHIATMQDARLFLISNHYRELSRLAETMNARSAAGSLSERPEFQGLASSALASSTFTAWLDPKQITDDLRQLQRRAAEDGLEASIDWSVERPRIEKQVLAEEFPGETWGQLSQEVSDQLQFKVAPRVEEFRAAFAKQNLGVLYGRIERRMRYLESIRAALVQLQLEPKDFELALRVLTDFGSP